MARAVQQYLDRYAEPDAALASSIERSFGHVLTIPAYGEGPELNEALRSVPAGPDGEVLVVVVVNGREDSPEPMRAANRATLERLGRRGVPIAPGAKLARSRGRTLLLIDRASCGRELPPRQGVGLARKIAADLALALWARGSIASPWIHCTDADVKLPPDYFARAGGVQRAAAIVFPFRHSRSGDPIRDRDALEYEVSLRYYVAGLRHAGSPYAYHSIGSTLAVHARAYAQVRGFPRRLAAEDFYLLNKLAKLGNVEALGGAPISLSARSSERTPFGTGRALRRARERPAERLRAYHPGVFSYVGAWQQVLRQLVRLEGAVDLDALLRAQLPAWPDVDAALLRSILETLGSWQSAVTAASSPPGPIRAVHARESFDAARTLKLVHALRAGALPSPPLAEALAAAPFLAWARSDGLEAARAQLADREIAASGRSR